jgi:hypothetical protein
MTNRLLTLAVIGAVGAGSAASIATARDGRGKAGSARTQIATVSSYASGTLTLTTSGGAAVTAKVTRRTRIACLPLASTGATTPTETTPAETTPTGTTPTRRGPRGDEDDERGGRGPGRGERLHRGDDDDDAVCDTSSLSAGTGVIAAATELTATGQRFSKLVLVSSASSTDS